MLQLFAVIHVILSISVVGLILMHSGRDTGFGGMGFTPASQGGTHIVERNLTRLTVVVGILFFANTIALFHRFGLAAGDRERERLRSPAAFRRGRRVARGLPRSAGAGGARQVPDGAAQNTVLDERDTLLRDALEVEPLRQAARVERVIGDRDLLVEAALTELAGEVAALLEQR